jgi:uncharacterized protein with PIN domain
MPETPRFIADVMLGRLAKWLRLLGYDTLYSPEFDDRTVMRISRQEGRILLTRDTGIMKSKARGECVFIANDHVQTQLLEVARALKAMGRPGMAMNPRCSLCNGSVKAEERKVLLDELPEHILLHQSAFFRCQVCGKVYWNGSHSPSIAAVRAGYLEEMRPCCAN